MKFVLGKKRKIYLGLVLVLILASFISYRVLENKRYVLVPVKQGKMIESIYALGKVVGRYKYEVKVGIMTNVEKIFVKEGDFVKKGMPLIKFKDTGTFSSPLDGTITYAPYGVGETVLPQVPAIRVENLLARYIEVSLEQQAAIRAKIGQIARLVFEGVSGITYQGKVTALFPRDDEFLAHIQVDNLGEEILPGMSVDVAIMVSEIANALLIPVKAVFAGKVLIIRDGKKQKVDVKVSGVDGPMAQVIEGILPTDTILMRRN